MLQEARPPRPRPGCAAARQAVQGKGGPHHQRFLKLEVYDKIESTEEELGELQKQTGRDRAIRVRRIVLRTEEEANEVAASWRRGTDSEELAAPHPP